MTITLPDDTLAVQQMSEGEIKRELALSLYSIQRLTLIQAMDMAGLGFFEFQTLLKERGIPQHYSEQDFDADRAALAALS